ncbi:tryptophan synthase subunit alpha [Brevifollis gellanilyticus]|uniref:Tryptophan synthase alpha chain n=1 Tax=Brevifollis gellanilyticus TaxID=748831 RepID=A0A512MH10_9BACT|nr:tryptophan synthase subunit alpha [Brevifollis gellanilyticus]GEP46023.1 tryptophan synthase alpha chain [Brevifollis gellanilyticus]
MSAPANRIDTRFADLKASGKRAFVAYVAAGDPTLDATIDIVLGLERAGVDIVELGVPFSDPLADGVVNQLAADRALKAGATMPKVLEMIRQLRVKSQIPIVLFTYLNPVYTYGYERFHKDAAAAGADGVLVLDLPPDEVVQNTELKPTPELCHIQLIAPTSPPERIASIAKSAEGFVYYVSRLGVTGAQVEIASGIAEQVQIIKGSTQVPVCVGFGVSNPEQAAKVASMADGVVVGSAIVKLIEKNGASPDVAEQVEAFVKPLVDAVHAL